MKYILVPAPKAHCPNGFSWHNDHPVLLQRDKPRGPKFYICFECKKAGEITVENISKERKTS